MKNYKELIIWQKGIQLVKSVYALSKSFPGEEKFGMISQVTSAAVSIRRILPKEAAETVKRTMQDSFK